MKIDSSGNVILYHGSTGIIEPKYGEGAKDNDYGVGFYCTCTSQHILDTKL